MRLAVERAVDAANDDCADGKDADQSQNIQQAEADSVAHEVRMSQRGQNPDTPM